MKKGILGIIALVLCINLVNANLYITEIMHSPTQVSDTTGEWIEIYNDGSESVNLNGWTLKGKSLGNNTIKAKEYLVVARKLVSTNISSPESFEYFWGNNNGIWDENYSAIQASISLTGEGTINLTNGIYLDSITYNSSFGGLNGKTIERISITEWKESVINGNPGTGTFSTLQRDGNEIQVYLNVENNLPIISYINFSEDYSTEEGIQILPSYKTSKIIGVEVLVNDSDGLSNIKSVEMRIKNESYSMNLSRNVSSSSGIYNGNFEMSSIDKAGEYSIEIIASDYDGSSTLVSSFEYLSMIATELEVSDFNWSLSSNENVTDSVSINNLGNVKLDVEVSAEDFISLNGNISRSMIEVYSTDWVNLENSVNLDLNVEPASNKEVLFRFKLPENTKAGKYQSRIKITSMESIK
mgnify:CR=1 FL=1